MGRCVGAGEKKLGKYLVGGEKELLVNIPMCLAREVHAPPPKTSGDYSGIEARWYD